MEWNRRQSHDCSDYHIELPRFSSRASQNKTRDTTHVHVIRNGGDRCFVRSNEHCIECHLACVQALFFYEGFEVTRHLFKNHPSCYINAVPTPCQLDVFALLVPSLF
jgi:hypothetical protein